MQVVYVPDDVVPKGVECLICRRVARPGQLVAWHQIINVKHVVMHVRPCLEQMLEMEPNNLDKSYEEEYTEMMKELKEGFFNGKDD